MLLLEEAHPVECDSRHRCDGLQDPQLVVAEEGCIRRSPDDQCCPRLIHVHRHAAVLVGRRCILGDDRPVGIDDRRAPRTDEGDHRPEHSLGDLGPSCGQRHQPDDRLLHPLLFRLAPVRADDLRRAQSEHETDAAPEREDLGEQSGDRGLIGRERGEDDRESQGGGGEREHPHPARRNGWLLTARPPEPNGHDDREQRPVDEEHDHVGEEPRRAWFARGRDVWQREGPDAEPDRHDRDYALQPA